MKRFLRRLLPALLLAALALYPLYLVAGNWYLRSGDLERRLNRRPERLLIQSDSAWTSWPGVVHVRNFRIRHQTRTVQWWAAVDRATFNLSLFDLRQRELRIDGLRGTGVTFHLHRRVDVPRSPGRQGARRDPWHIRLARVDLDDVREIWVDELRFTGVARVAGGFDMTIWRRLRIDPTRLQIVSGDISLGSLDGGPQARPILTRASGHVDGEIAPYSPAEHRGWRSLHFLSGRAEVAGVVPNLAFLDDYLQRTRWLTVEARDGQIAADLRVRRGRLLPGSRLEARPARLTAHALDYRAEGPGRVLWQVLPGQEGRLDLDFRDYQVARQGYRQPHVRGRGLRIQAWTDEPHLIGLNLFSPRRLAIEVPTAEVPRLAFYNAYLPPGSGLELTGGAGRLSARFRAAAPDWTGHGDLRLEARGVAARFEGRPLQGDLLLRTELREADFRGRRFDVSGTKLDVSRVRMAGAAQGDWWARIHLDRAVLEPGAPALLRARIESTLSDPRPIFAYVAPAERRSRVLRWVDDLLNVQGVGAVADVEVGSGGVAIEHMAVAGGQAQIQGRIRFGSIPRRGILYASYGRWDVGLELDGDERDWKILRPKQWFANQMGLAGRTSGR